MRDKEKLMIYPFDVESSPIVRHSSLIQDYIISHVVSPKGFGLDGRDIGCADVGQAIGVLVESDFNSALKDCDTVFFNECSIYIDFNELIYPKLIEVAKKSKNIICAVKLEDDVIQEVTNICNSKGKSFTYYKHSEDINIRPGMEWIYPIDVPIIFVIGLGERTHKFEIQLALRENLMNMGYKVSQIGTRHYCEIMGFHSFPRFMYSTTIPESEKITLFNHYIKNIEIKEKPDVIIIGVPGGIMPFNNQLTNRFGIIAYEVSQAILPDAVVLSTLYNYVNEEFFELISNSCKYKFGYSIDCFNVANVSLDIQAVIATKTLDYITMNWEFINDKKKPYSSLKTPVYNVLDVNDAFEMSNFLVDKLSEYGETEII